MFRLIKIDFYKYGKSRTFWVLFITYLVTMTASIIGIEQFLNKALAQTGADSAVPIPKFSFYSFPYVWHNMAYLAGMFKIFLALIIIFFVTNEFSYRTLRQNVMNGMSRNEFIWSKILFVVIISLAATLILLFPSMLMGIIKTKVLTWEVATRKSFFILAYFYELLVFGSFALFIAFLVKRSALAIGLLAFYYFILEKIIVYKLPDDIAAFLPIKAMGSLVDVPNSGLMKLFGVNFREYVATQDIIVSFVWMTIFITGVFLLMRKRDI